MATTYDEIAGFLDQLHVHYQTMEDGRIGFGLETEVYKNPKGQNMLSLWVVLSENGEYFELISPFAYSVPTDRAPMFLTACAMVQHKTKLIQFEWDHRNGEVRPIIEFPLEDARMTKAQLARCIGGMASLMEAHHASLLRAAEEGVIDAALA